MGSMQQLLYLAMFSVALVAVPAKAQQLQLLVGVEKPSSIKGATQKKGGCAGDRQNYFSALLPASRPNDSNLTIQSFFQPNHYHMLARTPELAERFNKALAEVKQSDLCSQLQLQYCAELNH